MISRRNLLKTAAATGTATMLLPAMGNLAKAAQPGASPREVVSGYISIRTSADPEFSPLLDTHFPGLADDVNFQKIRSHAVIITNVSGEDINAFSTFWKVDSATGGYEVALRHLFHPSEKRLRTVHFGTRGNQTRFTGQIPAIKAGATRLLTPYFNWSSSYYQKNPHLNWMARIEATGAHGLFTVHELSMATAVHVSVDAVIVKHNQVIGPDRARLAKTYMVMRNAEHDTAIGVLRAINVSSSDKSAVGKIESSRDQIQGYLEGSGLKYPTMQSDAFKDRLYRKVRQRQATILARRLRHATPEQFFRTVQYLASQPKTTVKRVSLT
jgi:TAT (twin-arginine translocation) pathway signal sequence